VNFEILIWGATENNFLIILALKPNKTMKAIIITAILTAIEAIPNLVTVAENVSDFGFLMRCDIK
jgi:hypothetical protein